MGFWNPAGYQKRPRRAASRTRSRRPRAYLRQHPPTAAKAAVGGLTRRLAWELGPRGIRVNAVAPGLFLTPRLAARFDAMPEPERCEVLEAIPLGRIPEPPEIVDPILFLASDAASFITGATLDVNGGRYLSP
jgi:3-oxoacyl-[acyl-carrier protein] reductase